MSVERKRTLEFTIILTNDTERCFECLIQQKRYQYFFADGNWEETKKTVRYLESKSKGICLQWLKKHSSSVEKVQ